MTLSSALIAQTSGVLKGPALHRMAARGQSLPAPPEFRMNQLWPRIRPQKTGFSTMERE